MASCLLHEFASILGDAERERRASTDPLQQDPPPRRLYATACIRCCSVFVVDLPAGAGKHDRRCECGEVLTDLSPFSLRGTAKRAAVAMAVAAERFALRADEAREVATAVACVLNLDPAADPQEIAQAAIVHRGRRWGIWPSSTSACAQAMAAAWRESYQPPAP